MARDRTVGAIGVAITTGFMLTALVMNLSGVAGWYTAVLCAVASSALTIPAVVIARRSERSRR